MDKFTEKIGLFDIWTVLFPGTVFLIVIKSLYNSLLILPELVKKADNLFEKITIFLQMNFYTSESLYELIELLLIAYLVGLLLQELGSIFKNKVLYKKGKPIDLLGDPQGGVFNAVQIQKLSSLFTNLNGEELTTNDKTKQHEESRYIFHKMNSTLIDKKIAGQYAKLNALYNMSINLAMVFMLTLLISLIFEAEFIFRFKQYYLIVSLVFLDGILIVTIYLLIHHGKRYYLYWTRNIVYAYQKLLTEESI